MRRYKERCNKPQRLWWAGFPFRGQGCGKADTSALEAEIDEMVYDLYGLTEEEREIVEEGVGP